MHLLGRLPEYGPTDYLGTNGQATDFLSQSLTAGGPIGDVRELVQKQCQKDGPVSRVQDQAIYRHRRDRILSLVTVMDVNRSSK